MLLRRTMSGSIVRMASEIRCLLPQKPRQFNCTTLNVIYFFARFVVARDRRVEMWVGEQAGITCVGLCADVFGVGFSVVFCCVVVVVVEGVAVVEGVDVV